MASPLDLAMMQATFTRWNADKAPRLAAAISFATIFAIAPLFIIVIAIAGYVIGVAGGVDGQHAVEDRMLGAIASSAGPEAAGTVRTMVSASFDKPLQSIIAQVVGWIMLVFGAAGLFAALQDALNTVWHVEPPKKGLVRTIRDRLASVGMLLAVVVLLLVTTLLGAAIAFVATHVAQTLPFPGAATVFGLVNWMISVAIVTLLFAVIYKYLPDADIEWRDVRTGAFMTALAFTLGQTLIAWYLGRTGVASAYGAAGSLLALLLWVYYSSMILLLGAEFTCVFAEKHGSHIGRARDTAPPPAPPELDPERSPA